jgi:hypothetical protein
MSRICLRPLQLAYMVTLCAASFCDGVCRSAILTVSVMPIDHDAYILQHMPHTLRVTTTVFILKRKRLPRSCWCP